MKTQRILTSETAELLTAQVSIKTLTVSGRQVTLAVFRQLLIEDVIDYTNFTLRGLPWGHVRYHVEDSHEKTIHVIWQSGSELRRCLVRRDWNPDYGGWESQTTGDVRKTSWDGNVKLHCGGWSRHIPNIRHEYEVSKAEIEDFLVWVNARNDLDNRRREAALLRYAPLMESLFSLPQLFIAV